jgi:hypothetical protein
LMDIYPKRIEERQKIQELTPLMLNDDLVQGGSVTGESWACEEQ